MHLSPKLNQCFCSNFGMPRNLYLFYSEKGKIIVILQIPFLAIEIFLL